LALSILALSISQVFNSIIFGTEKFDLEAKIPLKDLIHSKTFIVFTLPYIKALIVLPALYLILSVYSVNSPVDSALYAGQLVFIAEITLLVIRVILARKILAFTFPWKNLLKYSFASAVMATCLLVVEHPTRISATMLYIMFGGIIYLIVLLAMDKDARELVKAILVEIKSAINRQI